MLDLTYSRERLALLQELNAAVHKAAAATHHGETPVPFTFDQLDELWGLVGTAAHLAQKSLAENESINATLAKFATTSEVAA